MTVLGRALGARHHLDHAVLQVIGNGVEETPERHQGAHLLILDGLGRFLEGREHGALARGHMLGLDAVLAHLGHNVGQHLKLVVHKRVAVRKVLAAGVTNEVAARTVKGEHVFEYGALGLVVLLELCLGGFVLLQHTALDNLIHAGAGERKARVKAALNLGEVVAHDYGDLVDGLLAGHHDPHAATATAAQFLDERLQRQHQACANVGIGANKLTHLVDHEQQAELAAALPSALVGILLDHLGKGVGSDGVVLGTVEPVARRLLTHAQDLLQGLDNVVLKVTVTLAVLEPVAAANALVGSAELLRLTLAIDMLLQACKLKVLAKKAQVLKEHALKGAQQCRARGIALFPLATLAVDVKQDRLGGNLAATTNPSGHDGIGDLAIKVIDGALAGNLIVLQQIREHLEEVRFTGAKEAADPHAHVVGGNVEGLIVRLEKVRKVALQLARHHVLVELLAHRIVTGVLYLNDAVDGTVDVLGKQVLDDHLSLLRNIERAVIVAGVLFVEQLELAAIKAAGVHDDDGHGAKIGKHVVEQVVNAQHGVDLAHAREQDHVAGLVRLGVLQQVLGKALGTTGLLQLLDLCLRADLCLAAGNRTQDTALLANVEHHVVQVKNLQIARQLAGLGVCHELVHIGAALKLQRGVVAKRIEADLVADASVGQKVLVLQALAQGLAAMIEVLVDALGAIVHVGTRLGCGHVGCGHVRCGHGYITCPVRAATTPASPSAWRALSTSGST